MQVHTQKTQFILWKMLVELLKEKQLVIQYNLVNGFYDLLSCVLGSVALFKAYL